MYNIEETGISTVFLEIKAQLHIKTAVADNSKHVISNHGHNVCVQGNYRQYL